MIVYRICIIDRAIDKHMLLHGKIHKRSLFEEEFIISYIESVLYGDKHMLYKIEVDDNDFASKEAYVTKYNVIWRKVVSDLLIMT